MLCLENRRCHDPCMVLRVVMMRIATTMMLTVELNVGGGDDDRDSDDRDDFSDSGDDHDAEVYAFWAVG